MSLHQFPSYYTEDESCTSENDFRGFQKSPIVLCERIDIKSYLNDTLKKEKEKHTILKNYLRKCTVNVVREDLDQLKKKYLSKFRNIHNLEQKAIKTIIRCNICKKAYISAKRLQNHTDKKHMLVIKSQPCKTLKRVSFSDHIIIHELKEYHKCRKCPKIFEDYKSLKAHMRQVHKKRNCFICFYCSRQFNDRMFFKVHIKMHCGLCGVFYSNKIQLNEHKRTVCKDYKKYICKICNNVFFSSMSRKDHSYGHEGIIHVCDICKERFTDKCVLSHHIHCLHSRSYHRSLYSFVNDHMTYECNFCNLQFNNETEIKEHVTKLPKLEKKRTKSYKDYYFCDRCSEQFMIETDMLQHKWIHFLKKDPRENKEISTLKQTYRINEELPKFLQPKLILHKLKPTIEPMQQNLSTKISNASNLVPSLSIETDKNENSTSINCPAQATPPNQTNEDITNDTVNNYMMKKLIYDPSNRRKILFSNHQCKTCCKYFSTNFSLNRHIQTLHVNKQVPSSIIEGEPSLKCPKCEEVFVWPSLLQSHNCIQMRIPDMPFDDARPEIMINNILEYSQNWLNTDLYMDDVEMPAPIVELTEYEDYKVHVNTTSGHVNLVYEVPVQLNQGSSQIIIQEVPVEF